MSDPITLQHRPRTYLIIGLVTLTAAALAVGAYLYTHNRADTPTPTGAIGQAPPTHTITGDIKLDTVAPGWTIGDPCTTASTTKGRGYTDIAAGTQIVITDPDGKTVALGQLDPGKVAPDPVIGDPAKLCMFTFSVEGVPEGLSSYGVEIAHRGRLQYTEADLDRYLQLKLA